MAAAAVDLVEAASAAAAVVDSTAAVEAASAAVVVVADSTAAVVDVADRIGSKKARLLRQAGFLFASGSAATKICPVQGWSAG